MHEFFRICVTPCSPQTCIGVLFKRAYACRSVPPDRHTLCSRLEQIIPQNAGINGAAQKSVKKKNRKNREKEMKGKKTHKNQKRKGSLASLLVSEHKVRFCPTD